MDEERETTDNHKEDVEIDKIYKLKRIHIQNISLKILTQNKNGPCPLLAICTYPLIIGNVLILQGELKIPPEKTDISYEHLGMNKLFNIQSGFTRRSPHFKNRTKRQSELQSNSQRRHLSHPNSAKRIGCKSAFQITTKF
jgi:hypothetical protein